jgi:hypothetical protein
MMAEVFERGPIVCGFVSDEAFDFGKCKHVCVFDNYPLLSGVLKQLALNTGALSFDSAGVLPTSCTTVLVVSTLSVALVIRCSCTAMRSATNSTSYYTNSTP